jgi:hypothetical protein
VLRAALDLLKASLYVGKSPEYLIEPSRGGPITLKI